MTKQTVTKKSSGGAKHKIDTDKDNIVKIGNAGMKILNVAAKMKLTRNMDSLEREKISFFTGIKGKSTIANALTELDRSHMITRDSKTIFITKKGMELADVDDSNIEVPSTNEEYHKILKEQNKLRDKACKFIDYLADGKRQDKKKVAEALGMKINSTFANMLTECKKHGMVEYDAKTIRLTDDMFPVTPRIE